MKISMRDVAEHAGVSVATVSHVINQTRYVSEDTVARVQNSIRELGYIPDPIGRIFKTGKKNLIGFIVPDIANPVWAIIIEEVESVLATHGNKLIIINTKEDEQRELENIQLLASGIVDGLIIASTSSSFDAIRSVVPEAFPMVFIDRTIPNCPCDTIVPQDYNAIYEGVEQFILSGHQRIGIITGQMRLSTSQIRLNAYKAAMEHYNLTIAPEYIQYGNSLAKSSVMLLPPLLEAQCTALVVSNNIMAGDVLQYLDDQGIRIGTDISLLGQGVENNLDYSLRKMDLMVQPSAEIGRKAGEQILNRINNPQMPIQNMVLYSRLLKRDLSRPADKKSEINKGQENTTMEKLIITIAPNGESRTKQDNPNIPITVDEVVSDVYACYQAGASLVHLHGRDPVTQAISWAPEYYCQLVEGIRAKCDIIINFSTGGTTEDPYERLNCLAAKPDMCSLSGGSTNFTGKTFVNHPDVIQDFARIMYEHNVKPNIECFDLSHTVWAKKIASSDYYKGNLSVDILMNKPGNLPFTPRDLLHYVESLPEGTVWNTVGDGEAQLQMAAMAIISGGHVRVGIEDNNEYVPGQLATNVALVERIVRLAKELGREIATPAEARKILQLD